MFTLVFKLYLQIQGLRQMWKLKKVGKDLRKAQWQVLKGILRSQQSTDFGLAHEFSNIQSIEDFQRSVPVFGYEELRPWIEKQEETGRHVINAQEPVLYAVTSGTTGRPKYIPVLPSTISKFRQMQNLFVYGLYRVKPNIFSGSILAIASPAIEGYMPGGTPYGSTSGHMYEKMPAIARSKYVLPVSVVKIEDYELKYKAIVRFALAHPQITYMGTANPSTLVRLSHVLNQFAEEFLDDLENGTFTDYEKLPTECQHDLLPFLKPQAHRAYYLRAMWKQQGTLLLKDVWPDIQAIGCWTGGSSQIFLDQLKVQLDETTLIRELGYLSSEFRGTIPVSGHGSGGVPTVQFYFYEFVEREKWDAGVEKFVTIEQTEVGKQYYIFVTTDSGLYRYNVNDVVEICEPYLKIPQIQFVQKGKGVTNITGEKLYESQIISAVQKCERQLDMHSSFYIALADEASALYKLFYEAAVPATKELVQKFEMGLEQELQFINLEYETKRKSGRLQAIQVVPVMVGTGECYRQLALAQGQREGQYKVVALKYQREEGFDFDKYSMSTLCDDMVSTVQWQSDVGLE